MDLEIDRGPKRKDDKMGPRKEPSVKKWEYDISTYTMDDLKLESVEEEVEVIDDPVVVCDPGTNCFFSDKVQPEIVLLTHILNRRGAEGWELVQFHGHKHGFHCFWKREVRAD
jgi:hypothetical protein